jgi:putative glycosyltransferase (TIGR04372 family)
MIDCAAIFMLRNVNYMIHTVLRLLRAVRFRCVRLFIRLAAYGLYVFLKILDLVFSFRFVIADDGRIGGLLPSTESYLREKAIVNSREKSIFVYAHPCSLQFVAMLKRIHTVIQSGTLLRLIREEPIVSRFVARPKSLNMKILARDYFANDKGRGVSDDLDFTMVEDMEPALEFSPSDHQKGVGLLNDMGIGVDDWFICFHSRDGLYLKTKGALGRDSYGYHDYRDCTINNYLPAAEYITSLGGHAVRMGYLVMEKCEERNGIVDYANRYRSDFGDIYLPAQAKFFLGNTSGLVCASDTFNVPVAAANWIPLAHALKSKRDLLIPKKIWSMDKKRLLTFGEILAGGIGSYWRSEDYVKVGLEAVENTAEEIKDLTVEMYERLSGTWEISEEDEELQGLFRSQFDLSEKTLSYTCRSRIGAKFLRENRDLLMA